MLILMVADCPSEAMMTCSWWFSPKESGSVVEQRASLSELPDSTSDSSRKEMEPSSLEHFTGARERLFPLLVATFSGRSDRLQSIVSGGSFDIDQRDTNGATPLHVASMYGHKDCLRILLKNGASPNALDKDNRTALHKACYHGRVECVKALIEHGVSLNQQDRKGATALHLAVLKNQPLIISVLLEAGASHSSADKRGLTPLHLACAKNRVPLCQLLVGGNADVEVRDCQGETPLDICLLEGYHQCAAFLIKSNA